MKKHDTAVLFIHGILEGPNQFSDMIKAVEDKCDTKAVLLPGHGKTGSDFARSGMKEWQSYTDKVIQSLRNEYEKIYIVGHSMGCLTSICSAVKNPEKICGLFMIAPPFSIRLNKRGIKNGLIVAFNISQKDEEFCRLIKSVYSVSDCKLSDYPRWIPRYEELMRKSIEIREILSKLTVPMYCIFSQKDEYVSTKSIKYLAGFKNYRLLILNRSGHFYYTVEERKKIIEEFIKFIGI